MKNIQNNEDKINKSVKLLKTSNIIVTIADKKAGIETAQRFISVYFHLSEAITHLFAKYSRR